MALGRNHVLGVVAIVGVASYALIGASVFEMPHFSMSHKPGYVRVNVSDKSAVYLEFKTSEMRVAGSAEGLKTAKPLPLKGQGGPFRGPGQSYRESPELELPIPADQLPEGVSVIKGTFLWSGDRVWCTLRICRMDAQNAVWQCVDRDLSAEVGNNAGAAQAMQLPRMEKLALVVEGRPSAGMLGVGVHLMAGDHPVRLFKDGQPVPVQFRATDASGKEIAAKTGPLTDFAFS